MLRWKASLIPALMISLALSGAGLAAQPSEQSKKQPPVNHDEQVDAAMNALADFDLLRLRVKPPEKKGASVTPPFKQQPPSAQKDFCPNC